MTTASTRFAAGPAKMTATRFQVGARQYASGASASWISVEAALGRSASERRDRRVAKGGSDALQRRPGSRRSRSRRGAAADRRRAGRAAAPPRSRARSGRRGRPAQAGASRGSSRSRRAGSHRRRTRSRSASSSRSPAGSRDRTCAGSCRRRGRRRSGPPRGSGSETRGRGARRRCSRDQHSLAREPARVGVGLDELGQIARGRSVRGLERGLDDLRDPEERQPPLEEGRNRNLVGRIEDGWIRAAGLPALRASASSGNVSRSGAANSSVRPEARSSWGTSVAARSGYVSANEIGTVMSG